MIVTFLWHTHQMRTLCLGGLIVRWYRRHLRLWAWMSLSACLLPIATDGCRPPAALLVSTAHWTGLLSTFGTQEDKADWRDMQLIRFSPFNYFMYSKTTSGFEFIWCECLKWDDGLYIHKHRSRELSKCPLPPPSLAVLDRAVISLNATQHWMLKTVPVVASEWLSANQRTGLEARWPITVELLSHSITLKIIRVTLQNTNTQFSIKNGSF